MGITMPKKTNITMALLSLIALISGLSGLYTSGNLQNISLTVSGISLMGYALLFPYQDSVNHRMSKKDIIISIIIFLILTGALYFALNFTPLIFGLISIVLLVFLYFYIKHFNNVVAKKYE